MSQASESDICQAVLGFVTEGAYPEENVVAAKFPAAALAKELELISQAREKVENEISSLSRENNTFDADDWIIQARQLHADIERSRVTAREIVSQHEQTKPLQAKVDDAHAKVGLIETEIAFNEAVAETLEEVQRLCQQLESGRAALGTGRIMTAIEHLESASSAIQKDTPFSNTNVMGILLEETTRLRKEIEEAVQHRWSEQLKVDRAMGQFHITSIEGTDSLEETITSLSRLNILVSATDKLQKDLESVILGPILASRGDSSSRAIEVTETAICVAPAFSKTIVAETFSRVTDVLNFLRKYLPSSLSASIPPSLIPAIASKAISGWLSSAIPTTLDGLEDFENTLDSVLQFTKTIESWGWTGQEELVSWVNQAPRLWLTRRRVDSLDSVRKAIAASNGSTKQVERVEKEEVSQVEEALLENAATDDWDAEWDDDKEEAPAADQPQEDEEDVSAWGLDDEDDTIEPPSKPDVENAPEEDDDADDAWGWGDDDEEKKDERQKPPLLTETKPASSKSKNSAQPKEVILREVYTITDIPDSILDIMLQQIFDSQDIAQPQHSNSRVASSGAGLLALPTLILAMFKATSSSFYSLKLNSGQMYLYNDSLYLAGRVRELIEEHSLIRLSSDVEALEKFGKFAYSKEMQTQSTIVTDLLDGAQAFGQCSENPYKMECENAVSATVDRIRDVYKEWQPILSHSALLQSIGSLLSTVISKIIMDVEDLGDISEDQSKQLVLFCNQVSSLEDLFMPESTGESEAVPVTAVYVPIWLRFQYLINILESSLADIKFLWIEGELGLEFSMDEVIDLIIALFADDEQNSGAEAAQRQVRVQLMSKQEDIALPESTGPILVPTGLRRYALSTLVNNLLSSEKPIPFEFLINGTFLRTSIDEYLTANGISAETTLEIEYVRALIPPLHIASFEHDDWVSATDVLSKTSPAASWASGATFSKGQERILSGSYDGLLRIWNMSSEIIATSPGPNEAAKFVSPNQIATAGLDRTVRLWKYTEDENHFSGKLTPQMELYGHKAGIESLAVHAPSNRLLTGSLDHTVGFWSTKKADSPAAPENLLPSSNARNSKRRKLNVSVSTPQRGPLALLSAHTAPVSAAIFDAKDSTVGYSASWDHSLRTWDLVTASLVDTRTTSHSLLSLEHLPDHNLLAAGTAARHITLIDPRASAATVAAMTLRGHINAVVSLARDPHSAYGLISGSHDGTCRIWDIRSTKTDKDGVVGESVYSITRKSLEEDGKAESKRVGGEGVKVFSVCWDPTVGIVSAGEDKRIQINRGEGVLSATKQ
ncbi:uncharacterized protein N7483_007056 [Penicillium malachiteum]|uniref:uncharacterized protein n=1 Tax=Penicillium malachiteum TaxID=1324776 RepID=UPI002546E147|nr:uncharacterized protein N7483_007056 [Penicillium malachiteum]KAJ5725699.1 hypothetical protein N7483_007056 [Penicillium malachiteum]